MSRPLNQASYATPTAEAASRKTGSLATARSANGLLLPLSHIAGRIVPIYNLRPTERITDDAEGTTLSVAAWVVPYYPAHGGWFLDTEAALSGDLVLAFGGRGALEQFGPSFTLSAWMKAQHPSASANDIITQLPFELAIAWSTTAPANTSTTHDTGIVAELRRDPYPDPGDILDPIALSSRYGDVGPYNLTCRDAFDARIIGRQVTTAQPIHTGHTTTPARDSDAAIGVSSSIGTLGASTATARLYIGNATAYGISSDDADTTPDATTGDTVIPPNNSFTLPFGSGSPRSGQVLTSAVRDLIHLERTCYGARFQTLVSHVREDSTTGAMRAYHTADHEAWICAVRGAIFTMPDVLPGSANHRTPGSGGTAAQRGAIGYTIVGRRSSVYVAVREVTIAGTYGQSTTFGTWNGTTITNDTSLFVRTDGQLLLPTGLSPGDDYEIAIWWRASSAGQDGYLSAWVIYEPALTDVG